MRMAQGLKSCAVPLRTQKSCHITACFTKHISAYLTPIHRFVHLAEPLPHTGLYVRRSGIDVSSEHTSINYASRRNSFNIKNDLTTTVAASEDFDGFHQQAAASGGSQHVPASEVNPWLSADMWSRTRKLVRGSASNASLEGRKKDRDLESVQTLSEGQNLHVYLEQKAEMAVPGECAAQRRLSEAEADMDKRNWEQRSADIALYETNQKLESQRLELHQANQWADQAQREQINLSGELEMRNARNCQEIQELRRICCEETDRARQLRIDELSMQQERNPTIASQLLTQIQELKDNVNSLSDAREFYDPESGSSSGVSHVPNNP